MKTFKKIAISIFTAFILLVNINLLEAKKIDNYLDKANYSEVQLKNTLTVKWLFILYYNIIWEWIPDTYKFIKLKYKNVNENTLIYDALQKWVYLDLIKNIEWDLWLSKKATEDVFNRMILKNFWQEFEANKTKEITLDKFIDVMQELKDLTEKQNEEAINEAKIDSLSIQNTINFPILNDVYLKLKLNHYDSNNFTDEQLVRWAIKWMVDSTWDKFTTYFPPTEAKNFNDELGWSFEWIWAQVEMETAWVLQIIAPLPGTPAEKAWLKAWDRIMKIDELEITDKVSLQDAVNKIKWPSWTEVTLTILRGTQTLEIKVTRSKIIVDYVQYKKLDNWDNYIRITIFWAWVYNSFKKAVEDIAKNNPNGKTIIDLRNDPGWSLDEVSSILNYFVPKWEGTVNIKYKRYSTDLQSLWSPYNFIDKNVIVLINKWSASASEIMALTIKDYWMHVKLIWEKSYGKWSVQSLDDYADGSSFKYTIAKWFSGKTKTWIDTIWINPDIEVKLDEQWFKAWNDNQLNYAKNYRF